MMRLSQRGQSIGEYAVLFAVVLGAVFAMQNYVRARLAGAIASEANNYAASVNGAAIELSRGSESTSGTSLDMSGPTSGTVNISGNGSSTVTSYNGGP